MSGTITVTLDVPGAQQIVENVTLPGPPMVVDDLANSSPFLPASANSVNTVNNLARTAYNLAASANIKVAIVDSVSNTSNSLPASANAVNLTYRVAQTAINTANFSANLSNAVAQQTLMAYAQANSASNTGNAAFAKVNSAFTQANAGFAQANAAFALASTFANGNITIVPNVATLNATTGYANQVVYISPTAKDGGGAYSWQPNMFAAPDGVLIVNKWVRIFDGPHYEAAWWLAITDNNPANMTSALVAADIAAQGAKIGLLIDRTVFLNSCNLNSRLIFSNNGILITNNASQTVRINGGTPQAPSQRIFDTTSFGGNIIITNPDSPTLGVWWTPGDQSVNLINNQKVYFAPNTYVSYDGANSMLNVVAPCFAVNGANVWTSNTLARVSQLINDANYGSSNAYVDVASYITDTTAANMTSALMAADLAASTANMSLLIDRTMNVNTCNVNSRLIFANNGMLKPANSTQKIYINNGTPQAEFIKIFDISSGGAVYITKPDAPVKSTWWGTDSTGTLDCTNQFNAAFNATGVTLVPIGNAQNSNGNILVSTTTPHGLVSGQEVRIDGIVGMKELNGTFIINVLSNTTFTPINVTYQNAFVNTGGAYCGQVVVNTSHEVLIPPGKYRCSNVQTKTPNVKVKGIGDVILIPSGNTGKAVWSFCTSGCEIENIQSLGYQYSGFIDPLLNPTGLHIVSGSPNTDDTHFKFGCLYSAFGPLSNVKIKKVKAYGLCKGIFIGNGDNVIIDDIECVNNYTWAVTIGSSPKNFIGTNWKIKNSGIQEAIKFGFDGNTYESIDNLIIDKFIIDNCGQLDPDPDWKKEAIDMFMPSCNYVKISNGIIRNNLSGIEIKSQVPNSGRLQNIFFENIDMELSGYDGAGLNFHWGGNGANTGYPYVPTPDIPQLMGNVKITDCHMTCTNTTLPRAAVGIVICGWNNIDISDCSFDGFVRAIQVTGLGDVDGTTRNITISSSTKIRNCDCGIYTYGGIVEGISIKNADIEATNPISIGGSGGPVPYIATGVTQGALAPGGTSLIRLTVPGHNFGTNGWVYVSGMTGAEEANGYWKINVIDANNIDIISSVYLRSVSGLSGYATQSNGFTINPVVTNCRLVCTTPDINVVGRLITSVSNSGGLISVTSPNHGLVSGNKIKIQGVQGTIECNGNWTVKVTNANTFLVNDIAFANAYISGGSWTRTFSPNPSSLGTSYGIQARSIHNAIFENNYIDSYDYGIYIIAIPTANVANGYPTTSVGVIRNNTIQSRVRSTIRVDDGAWEVYNNKLQPSDETSYGYEINSLGKVISYDNVRGYKDTDPPISAGNIGEIFKPRKPNANNRSGWVCTTGGSIGSAVWTKI